MKRALIGSGIVVVLLVTAASVWWWAARGGVAREPQEARREAAVEGLSPPGPAAPDGVSASDLGEPFSFGSGHRITILDRREEVVLADPGVVVDALRVEVCAGDDDLVGAALPAAFALGYRARGGGFEYRSGATSLVAEEPALSTQLEGEVVAAGDCRQGWVAFVLGDRARHDRRRPLSVVFDNTVYGFVPEPSRARHAWMLQEEEE